MVQTAIVAGLVLAVPPVLLSGCGGAGPDDNLTTPQPHIRTTTTTTSNAGTTTATTTEKTMTETTTTSSTTTKKTSTTTTKTTTTTSKVLSKLGACVHSCLETDHSEHFNRCEEDGSTDCSKSKCCKVATNTCFVKNPYWSSCQPQCKKGQIDEKGDKWDCTPLSPSGCTSLQACTDSCQSSLGALNSTLVDLLIDDAEVEERPELAQKPVTEGIQVTGNPAQCTGGSMDVCKGSCEQFKDNEYVQHVCEVLCDKNCPDPSTIECPNKNGLAACLSSCKDTGTTTDSGSHCEKDGATSCLNSKCCQAPGAKCFTKNQYWASCTDACTPGKPNPLDGQVWDCKELKGKQVCDPYTYRTCAAECVRYC